jgi:glyoxylase-like metal-dependent hydrolase (beta-lactamase superfamily II)
VSGPDPVAPGVFRVPLPLEGDALKAVNVYVLLQEGRATLIDAGWALDLALNELEAALAALELDLGQVDRFLVTHMHRDHYTLAVRVRSMFGTRVAIGIGERASVEECTSGNPDGNRSWLRHWGAEDLRPALEAAATPHKKVYEMPDEWIEPYARITLGDRTLTAVPTPGHTQGHLVFADTDNGVLFAGDHVLPHITPSVGFETIRAKQPLGDYLASLQLMLELPDLRVLPAHGPVGVSSHQRSGELLEHHAGRLDATLDATDSNATASDVARAMLWTRHDRPLDALDVHNQMLAIAETAAHLDQLVVTGDLTALDDAGTRHYFLVNTPTSGGPDAHRDE